ncbi:major capsid protein [Microvirus mar63]|uniref:Major capsid protein n=1 Tax=Microvirus mar63 TaxID=2851200 RepID=A0A8F5RC55_9VIRU|nr:major capsid protein [Microvirus mar63]
MASYTGLSEKRVTTHRSGFDISQKNAFTAKVGELLPVYWDISMPGDSYRIKTQYFTRTQPVETSAYTRLREYFDWYAVPLRLLWKSAPVVITQMQEKESVQALSISQNLQLGTNFPSIPVSSLGQVLANLNAGTYDTRVEPSSASGFRNFFGFNRSDLSAKLFRYLHYGNFVDAIEAGVNPSGAFEWRMFGSSVINSTASNDFLRVNAMVNLFPLLAYQKIYQDFFRWSQWENANPSSYNVDYWTGVGETFELPAQGDDYWKTKGMFDLQYCNWNKDMFMSILPDSQFGDVAIVNLGSGASAQGELPQPDLPENAVYAASELSTAGRPYPLSLMAYYMSDSFIQPNAEVSTPQQLFFRGKNETTRPFSMKSPTGVFDNNLLANVRKTAEAISASFNVLALRQAEALQRRNEVVQSQDTDYRSQMEAQFGVKIPRALSNLAIYIGGMSRTLDISEVVNQSLSTEDSTAYIKGKGVGTGEDGFRFEHDEPCVIMCIYHALPLLDYDTTGIDPQLLITDAESYPQPAFDSIGMETIPSVVLSNSFSTYVPVSADSPLSVGSADYADQFIGWTPRYYHHKTKVDVVNGAFTTTLRSWVAPLNTAWYWRALHTPSNVGRPLPDGDPFTSVVFPLDYRFFKVNPIILDPIFGVNVDSTWDTDQLLINCYNEVYVARNLSRDGLPY